jgi:hypothetical protein
MLALRWARAEWRSKRLSPFFFCKTLDESQRRCCSGSPPAHDKNYSTTNNISNISGDRVPLPPLDELRRRDEVMRYMFTNRNWGSTAEYRLKRSFVLSSSTLLPDYPLLIDDEWEVVANRSDLGRGDLLFCSADGAHVAVVELKANSSSTAESVKEQARKYASAYYELYQVTGVRAYIVRTTASTAETLPNPELVVIVE